MFFTRFSARTQSEKSSELVSMSISFVSEAICSGECIAMSGEWVEMHVEHTYLKIRQLPVLLLTR